MMFDFRLKVFFAVAKRLSFTKAAEDVNISQPAVSKHIRELENELKSKLFKRNGHKIELTLSGQILLNYTEKIRMITRDFEYELNQLKNEEKGYLKIGASTTIAHYKLPKILAAFNLKYPEIKIELIVDNTEKISTLLEQGTIDCGLTEGKTHSNLLTYHAIIKDEIVLVTRTENKLISDVISINELQKFKYIAREKGSGTQEVIQEAFKKHHLNYGDLTTIMQLGSSESIKNYLLNSDALAFLSVTTIFQELKNNNLKIIDIDGFSILRDFYFISSVGDQSSLVQLFKNFISNNN